MSEDDMDDLSLLLREEYNPPPAVPRDEMWAAIQAGLEPRVPGVVALDEAVSPIVSAMVTALFSLTPS